MVEVETQYFIWHNGNMVYEFVGDEETSYTYGLRLISSDEHNYVLNAHGDVVALLNSNGEVTKRYEYDAFGNELSPNSSDTNLFRYCGEYFDVESGTIYLRARYYSPVKGRFTTKDPHWNVNNMIYGDSLEDNPKVRVPDILAIRQSANLYVYCLNNPVTKLDPNGEAFVSIAIAGALVVGSLVLSGCDVQSRNAWVENNIEAKSNTWQPNFAATSALHMQDPNRYVPVSLLCSVIENGIPGTDPQGSSATMYYSTINKNGKEYNIEVLYDDETDTIYHFKYTQDEIGPLEKIERK